MQQARKRAAVLLSGSGLYDGSEIMETTSIFFALHEH
jgi:enhancing lycopene biosynthesis protein 2